MSILQFCLVLVGLAVARIGGRLPERGSFRHRDFWVDFACMVAAFTLIFTAVRL